MEEYVKKSAIANAGNGIALSLHLSKHYICKTTEIPTTSYLWNIRRKDFSGDSECQLGIAEGSMQTLPGTPVLSEVFSSLASAAIPGERERV